MSSRLKLWTNWGDRQHITGNLKLKFSLMWTEPIIESTGKWIERMKEKNNENGIWIRDCSIMSSKSSKATEWLCFCNPQINTCLCMFSYSWQVKKYSLIFHNLLLQLYEIDNWDSNITWKNQWNWKHQHFKFCNNRFLE